MTDLSIYDIVCIPNPNFDTTKIGTWRGDFPFDAIPHPDLETKSVIRWTDSTVGKKNSVVTVPDSSVRKSFNANVTWKINTSGADSRRTPGITGDIETMVQALFKLLPEHMHKMFDNRYLKKSIRKIFKLNDGTDDYDGYDYDFQIDTILLAYVEGCFFVEHVDSQNDTAFGTCMIISPHSYEGGNLVLKSDSDLKVYDPQNLIERVSNEYILKKQSMSVMIAFKKNIPHRVDTITSGVRFALKFDVHYPQNANLFKQTVSEVMTKANVDELFEGIDAMVVSNKIQELFEKKLEIERHINILQGTAEKQMLCESDISEIEYNMRIVESFKSFKGKHMFIVFKSYPLILDSLTDISLTNKKLISYLSFFEQELLKKLLLNYKVEGRVLTMIRDIVSENDNIYSKEDAEILLKKNVGDNMKILDYDSSFMNTHFIGNEKFDTYGVYQPAKSSYEYNDSIYTASSTNLVFAILVWF